jgi:hypothetical protein
MHRMRLRPALARTLTALLCLAPVAAAAGEPDRIEGLEAWYRADKLQLEKGSGAVGVWPDASGRGHDLVDEKNGLPAVRESAQLNDLPAVRIGKANSHRVTDAFELGDHTVFVVFRTDRTGRALFGSDRDEFSGVALRAEGLHDRLHIGGARSADYGSIETPTPAWSITVLGRNLGLLHEFVDGVDRSSGVEYSEALRVGRFFRFSLTRFAKADGEGLRVAEMLFYRRFLTDAERAEVTRYLAEKYGIAVEGAAAAPEGRAPEEPVGAVSSAVAQLSTTTKVNINEAMVAIPWDRQDELDPPFAHDPEGNPTRLVCTRDDTRVRLSVSLPLTAPVDGINVRVMFRVNGALFLRGEGRSGPFGGPDGAAKASARAEVIATLNAGDYVEVLTLRSGAAGTATIDPDAATFIAETL